MSLSEWEPLQTYIRLCEEQGILTRTFRRLDPDRQQLVINAILNEAAQSGPTSLNIRRVAEQAGVSVGALYTYFTNRENMLEFAIQLCVRYTCETLNSYQPLLSSLPLRDALAGYLFGGIEWSRTQADLLQLFARAAYQDDPSLVERLVLPIAETLREMVQDILNQAASRGEIKPDVDLEAVARLLHALMIVVSDSQLLPFLNYYFQVTGEQMPFERVAESLLNLVEDGVKQS